MRIFIPALVIVSCLLASCSPEAITPPPLPTYDPFVPIDNKDANGVTNIPSISLPPNTPSGPTPTRIPLEPTFRITADPNILLATPTPDAPHDIPTPRKETDQYNVQPGDTLASIAQSYGLTTEALVQANGIENPDTLEVGDVLIIPAPDSEQSGSPFKIIPDSEFVYGPSSAFFDLEQFIQNRNGYLAHYSEEVDQEVLSGSQILLRVSQNYSINPRLLLAILEHQAGWVTNPDPSESEYPIGLVDAYHTGLYLQLTWTADNLNRGYYLWRANAVSTWSLADGAYLLVDPTINAGTAGIQNFYAKLDDREAWSFNVNETGLFLTYWVLFGNPFTYAFEPLIPEHLKQPAMSLPFEGGETWSFTGGPHGGWDSGSGWAALDFAPPGDTASCLASPSWATAVADGLILRAFNGAVLQDLDNDGYEGTGWVVLYMHIDSNGRVKPNQYLYSEARVGHPSCEGGLSNGTHLHLARRYNGEWIPADGMIPFNLDGWISSGNGVEYDGFLKRGTDIVEAWDGINELNQISP